MGGGCTRRSGMLLSRKADPQRIISALLLGWQDEGACNALHTMCKVRTCKLEHAYAYATCISSRSLSGQ